GQPRPVGELLSVLQGDPIWFRALRRLSNSCRRLVFPGDAIHLKAGEIGAGLFNGMPNGQLSSYSGRSATFASALGPQTGPFACQADQFDIAPMTLKIRADMIQSLAQTSLEVRRVQIVNKQESTHDLVVDHLLIDVLTSGSGFTGN